MPRPANDKGEGVRMSARASACTARIRAAATKSDARARWMRAALATESVVPCCVWRAKSNPIEATLAGHTYAMPRRQPGGGSVGRLARLLVCVCRTIHRPFRRSRIAVPRPTRSSFRSPTSPLRV